MCILIPSYRRGTKRCPRCTKGINVFPCMYCDFKPLAPSKDYRDNHNVQEQVHDKWN